MGRTIATFFLFTAACLSILQPAPPDPQFTARWVGTHTAVLRWQQPAGVAHTCLSREASGQRWLIRCWSDLREGATSTMLGKVGPRDYSVHPAAGDVYRLTFDDRAITAALRGVLWLPIVSG